MVTIPSHGWFMALFYPHSVDLGSASAIITNGIQWLYQLYLPKLGTVARFLEVGGQQADDPRGWLPGPRQ